MQLDYEFDFERRIGKHGKLGKGLHMVVRPYCRINTCEHCGAMGGIRSVRERHELYSWMQLHPKDFSFTPIFMLCTRCWGRIGHAVRQKKEADHLAYLARKLLRTIQDGNKDRGTSGKPDGVHREGKGREDGIARGNSHRQARGANQPVAPGGGERAA